MYYSYTKYCAQLSFITLLSALRDPLRRSYLWIQVTWHSTHQVRGGEIPVFGPRIRIQGSVPRTRALYLEQREMLKILFNECFRLFELLLFCFHSFGVGRSIDVLDPRDEEFLQG